MPELLKLVLTSIPAASVQLIHDSAWRKLLG